MLSQNKALMKLALKLFDDHNKAHHHLHHLLYMADKTKKNLTPKQTSLIRDTLGNADFLILSV